MKVTNVWANSLGQTAYLGKKAFGAIIAMDLSLTMSAVAKKCTETHFHTDKRDRIFD